MCACYNPLMAHDNDNLARLTSVRTEMEAGVIVGGLEDEGIRATMSGVYTTNFRAEAPGWVEVLVSAEDLPRDHAEKVAHHRAGVYAKGVIGSRFISTLSVIPGRA